MRGSLVMKCAAAVVVALMASAPAWAATKNDCKASLSGVSVQNLNFGTFVATGTGTVTVSPTGVRTFTGAVVLAGGTVSPATYDITSNIPGGCNTYTMTIRLPGNASLTETAGDSMRASSFVADPATRTGLLDASDYIQLRVGATVNVTAGQTQGAYTVPITVTIGF